MELCKDLINKDKPHKYQQKFIFVAGILVVVSKCICCGKKGKHYEIRERMTYKLLRRNIGSGDR